MNQNNQNINPGYPNPNQNPDPSNPGSQSYGAGQFPQQGMGFPPPPPPYQGKPNIPPGARTPMPQKPVKKGKKAKKPGNGKWVWLGILLMLILIVLGAIVGYNSAIASRQASYKEQSIKASAQQYQLALIDIENQNYQNAKTRLEWVLSVDANYPGATEKYTDVMINLYPKETPTPFYTPTPAPTATPDTRGEEEMLNTIRANMAAQEWETAINNMIALRDKNLSYQSLEVDGMYYIALRNYGIQLINSGYLEQGIYRITLAEAFGPIDSAADSQRMAARNYLAGAGFWKIDWVKALDYYANVYNSTPQMYDRASGLTAEQRFMIASMSYAQQLADSGDYCGAIPYFEQAFAVGGDPAIGPTATAVHLVCHPPTNTPEVLVPTPMLATPTVPGMPPPDVNPEPIIPPETIPDQPIVNPDLPLPNP